MKHFITIGLAATTLAAITFTSCSKEATSSTANISQTSLTTQATTSLGTYQSVDRIDEIVKDLSSDKYSLSFDKPNTAAGITKSAYGSDNYLVFADPQDLICPEPIRLKYKAIGIWKRPNFIQPTCPDMSIDIYKLGSIQELLIKADPAQYRGLQTVKLSNGGGFLASQQFLKSYSGLQTDRFDALTKDLDPAKFMLMSGPDVARGGVFARNFYGYADLTDIVFRPYKLNLKDLLKPTIKGCFDPEILQIIRERLAKVSPETYKVLNVTTLPENRSIGILN